MSKVGLVLEGGGMRGLYTCGVLEFFMEKEIFLDYIIGVSAGACNAASYISGQKGRNLKVNTNYIGDYRYLSLRNYILKKSFFGMEFIFKEIPDNLEKFDYETFYNSECQFKVVATDCKTGKAHYFNKVDMKTKGFEILKASSSLPLLAPIVSFDGYEFLDGSISDSIPILKSIEDGNDKNIIVLTRNKGYRKKPAKFSRLMKMKYRNYPLLVKAILERYKNYNDTLDYVEKLESQGNAIVIRPSREIKVGRMEKNPKKLHELYQNGYEDAENLYEKIKSLLSKTL